MRSAPPTSPDLLLQRVATVLREDCGLEPSASILVGVSGGPDSLCLAHALHALGCRLIIAHFDHQLRAESATEAAAVGAWAEGLGLPFVLQRADVREHAKAGGLSIEEAARALRYAFLFSHAHAHGAQAVAVGHTADDQVETVLMHLIRGSGLTGLKGMVYRTILPALDRAIPLVRPLLGFWREETLAYCQAHGLSPQHDPSNESLEFLRNRVRLRLIPELQSYNPRIREALWRFATIAASDLALLEEHVSAGWARTVTKESDKFVAFDAFEVCGRAPALQRRIILRAAGRLLPQAELDFATIERALDFLGDPKAPRLEMAGGLVLSRDADSIYLSVGALPLPAGGGPQFSQSRIALPSKTPVTVPLGDEWAFSAVYASADSAPMDLLPRSADSLRACMDADTLPSQLELRRPRPGDRIQPLGLKGHSQKLSDLFTNAKIARADRVNWPLLCSGETVVWVPGLRVAEPFRLRQSTHRVAYFVVSRIVPEPAD